MAMVNPFQGEAGANIRNSRWVEIIYASRGNPFSGVGADFLLKGLRDSVDLEVKAKTFPHVTGGLLVDFYDVSVKGKFYETSLDRILNMYLLSKDFHQLRLVNQNAENLVFKHNTGTPGTPVGSQRVGTKFKVVIEQDTRYIEVESITRLTWQEWNWVVDNFGVATGETGGTPSLPAEAGIDRTKQYPPGFLRISVDGDEIGIYRDSKMEFSFEGPVQDKLNRPIPSVCKFKGEVKMWQVAEADLKAMIEAGQSDLLVEAVTYGPDETITFNPGSISITPEFMLGDKEMSGKLTLQGDFPYNGNEVTPNSMDIGVTDPAVWTINRIGY